MSNNKQNRLKDKGPKAQRKEVQLMILETLEEMLEQLKLIERNTVP